MKVCPKISFIINGLKHSLILLWALTFRYYVEAKVARVRNSDLKCMVPHFRVVVQGAEISRRYSERNCNLVGDLQAVVIVDYDASVVAWIVHNAVIFVARSLACSSNRSACDKEEQTAGPNVVHFR